MSKVMEVSFWNRCFTSWLVWGFSVIFDFRVVYLFVLNLSVLIKRVCTASLYTQQEHQVLGVGEGYTDGYLPSLEWANPSLSSFYPSTEVN